MTNIADLIILAGETNEANNYNGYSKAFDDGYGVPYLAMKDLLEVGENCEGLEELRHGHTADEVYLGDDDKPEGYIIEKLDAVIRSFGTLYEVAQKHGVPIEEIENLLIGKIRFNARRKDTAKSGVKAF